RKVLHVLHVRRVRATYPFDHLDFIAELDPFSPDSIPRPHATWNGSRRLRLRWYMPEPGKGSGGHRTLFRLIDLLDRRGHASEACVLLGASTGKTRPEMRRFVAEEFRAKVEVVWDTDDVQDCDVGVASSWQTA